VPAPEQRRLAQAALDDADLFDALTAAALAQSAVQASRPATGAAEHTAPRVRRRWPALAALGTLAAAVVLAVTYLRPAPRVPESPVASTNPPPAPVATPILLVARNATEAPAVFRTNVDGRRLPRAAGTVMEVHDGQIELDLGSIDGVTQGTQVTVWRNGAAHEVARVRISTVFRERSRGQLTGRGSVRKEDRVQVDPAVHVRALLEKATARDGEAAREMLELAVKAAGPTVSDDVRREAFDRLGASLNRLGVDQIKSGDYVGAERTLTRAQNYAEGATKVRVANNLAAVKALQGDRAAAESLYRLALSLAGDSPQLDTERTSIQNNLNTVTTVR
jgi:hypothetical protein